MGKHHSRSPFTCSRRCLPAPRSLYPPLSRPLSASPWDYAQRKRAGAFASYKYWSNRNITCFKLLLFTHTHTHTHIDRHREASLATERETDTTHIHAHTHLRKTCTVNTITFICAYLSFCFRFISILFASSHLACVCLFNFSLFLL